jgi:hypothetical protein
MTAKTQGCPFCGKAIGKDGRTCGRAPCQAKAAVWSKSPVRTRGVR